MTSNEQKWRKNLFSNVGYQDNYTDISFLQQLRTNVNHHNVTVFEAILGAGRVTERLCIIFTFITLFEFLVNDYLPPVTIFLCLTVVAVTCYLWYFKSIIQLHYDDIVSHGKTVVIFNLLGFILSPVLKTLTESISTDTIYATTFFMMVVHLVFFDYKVSAAIVSNALSTNAAIFGSLCLASRLPSSFHAFVLLTSSVECFVLYPHFTAATRSNLSFPFLVSLIFVSSLMLISVSFQMLVFFLILILFFNGVCPLLFVHWQKYKHNIYGPWDEAVIEIKKD